MNPVIKEIQFFINKHKTLTVNAIPDANFRWSAMALPVLPYSQANMFLFCFFPKISTKQHILKNTLYPCPAEPRYTLPLQTVAPDQLASKDCCSVCGFISTNRIKESYWLIIRSGHGILIYSAWQGLRSTLANYF